MLGNDVQLVALARKLHQNLLTLPLELVLRAPHFFIKLPKLIAHLLVIFFMEASIIFGILVLSHHIDHLCENFNMAVFQIVFYLLVVLVLLGRFFQSFFSLSPSAGLKSPYWAVNKWNTCSFSLLASIY